MSPISVLDIKSGENSIVSSKHIPLDNIHFDLDQLIALRKGKQSCTAHPLYNFMSSAHLSSPFHFFYLVAPG